MDYKEFACSILNTFGLSFFLRKLNRRPRILFYHGVSSKLSATIAPENFHVEEFYRQIKYLKRYFDVISLDVFYSRYITKQLVGNEVVITFDDGYANNLYEIAPIMDKFNLPYSVFISTEHITTGEFFPTSIIRMVIWGSDLRHISIPTLELSRDIISVNDKKDVAYIVSHYIKSLPVEKVKIIIGEIKSNFEESDWLTLLKKHSALRPMTWDEVIKLSKKDNVIIGSHCKYHICCHSNQSEYIVQDEIIQSKAIIEDRLKRPCHYIAYPNGDYNAYAKRAVDKAKYLLGLAINHKKDPANENYLIIPRIGIPRSYNKFKLYLNLYPLKHE